MKLLDLFSGAGGAAMGYSHAGFTEIVGVDIEPQPHYPFTFVKADAFAYLAEHGSEFDVIHASPPCQRYSSMSRRRDGHPDLYAPMRTALLQTGKPFVIENVIGAPYSHGLLLCGSMFGLVVRRHRNFETSHLIFPPSQCRHKEQGRPIIVTGNGGGGTSPHSDKGIKSEWPSYMGMLWASPDEVTQSIPPAYTEFIGKALLAQLAVKP